MLILPGIAMFAVKNIPRTIGMMADAAYDACEHTEGWEYSNSAQHKCKICGHRAEHVLGDFLHEGIYCQSCQDCGAEFKHSFDSPTLSGCGICDVCGDTFKHIWSDGRCRRCGYKCNHSNVGADWQCNICGVKVAEESYYVESGIYAGSYIFEGQISGQNYYRQHQYDSAAGRWVAKDYYLVVINITTPTQFGGSYAYTGSGAAFVTSVTNFPINDSLFSGNGRYHIYLKQYSLAGEYIAEGSYTSDDCQDITGKLP